jgi:acetyl esterase/lipase
MTELQTQQDSFSSRVRGTDAREIDIALAHIAADSYNDTSLGVQGWRPLSEQELAAAGIKKEMLRDDRAGFMARVYADDKGGYVLAFRGTNEGKDWTHNLRQGIGLEDAQYAAAERLSRKAFDAFQQDLVITGHSLGGGLATLGAVTSGAPAVTFNSSGLNDATIRRVHRDPEATQQAAERGLIRRYAVDHEILTTLQEKNLLTRGLLPDAIGHKIELPDPEPLHGWKRLVPGSSLKHGLDVHGMDAVLASQQLAARTSLAHPAHPANRMFTAALDGLHGIQPAALGYASEDQYRNAAGSLVAKAREGGMQRIDHVVIGANGALFAVEGPLDDARHRIAGVDRTQAAAQPLESSSNVAIEAQRGAAAAAPAIEVHRRSVLAP